MMRRQFLIRYTILAASAGLTAWAALGGCAVNI